MAICVDCEREMIVIEIGVDVVEMAHTPPEPYKFYSADIQECPKCECKVIDSKSKGIIHFSHESGFDKYFYNALMCHLGKLIYIYEKDGDMFDLTEWRKTHIENE